MIAVQTGDKAAAAAAADGLVLRYGSNPNVVRSLVSTWFAAGDNAEARTFDRNIAKSTDDMTIGTLDFYLAVLLSQEGTSDENKAGALKALDAAEAHFKVALSPDNEVFGVIADIRNSLRPPAPAAGATAPTGSAAK